MPARRFDPERVLLARRDGKRKQTDVASHVGVSASRVSAWETGRSAPDPEKLPRLAEALGRDLDELFPRDGHPDLADLRADAGYTQAATKELTGTSTAGPVASAEKGQRRLASEYEAGLAEAYGVSVEVLLRAQDRSFGIDVPEPEERGLEPAGGGEGVPQTLAEKITLILERSYPGPQGPPSDAEMAARVNARMGADILIAEDFSDLRTGATDAAPAGVLPALAAVVGVSPLYFESDEFVAAQVYEGLQLLAAAKQGAIGRVKARGLGPQGLSPKNLALVNKLVAEMTEKEAEAGK